MGSLLAAVSHGLNNPLSIVLGQSVILESVAEDEATLARAGRIKAAAEHAAAIEDVLLADYQLERGQLDALWSYVGNKGEKKLP